ncbi:unnamed protein product [Durusdinium trenchii]|uniref:Integrase catalytic domain-containing protein n=1 Tax=Durusdinium trenchii TaxID=1381693 RepID=A0ABP0LWC2_9DINO
MNWWVSSLDLQATSKYNLAARWLLRQTGIVRQRGEEFNPDDLKHKPAEIYEDPVSGETIEVTPPDYLYGLNRLLDALEGINGQSLLDKRGELRNQFYLELKRTPGERVAEFCTRFRTLSADLAAEGVQIQATELGWFLRQKLGLDSLRQQLLETALAGREEYGVVEAECLRLFKDLHQNDPLRRFDRTGDRPRLTIRRLFQSQQSKTPSSSASTISRSPSMFSAATSNRSSSASSNRRAYVTEVADGEEAPAEEVLETVMEEHPPEMGEQSLEEVIQSEAECLATELQEAEEQGIDPSVLEDMEQSFEQAAEALVTMKEAKSRLQEVRKDRGFGKPGSAGGGRNNTGVPAARKASGKHPCFDCNQHGHWAGDKECPQPGAGLGRKGPAVAAAKAKGRHVRLTEAFQAEHVVEPTSSPPPSSTSPLPESQGSMHEVNMVLHSTTPLPLDRALEQSMASALNSTLISTSAPQGLAEEKHLVGALDSACNRSCAGPVWVESYLKQIESAPPFIRDLLQSVSESERFKFGHGGLAISPKRWLELKQMAAGHFMLELLPEEWPSSHGRCTFVDFLTYQIAYLLDDFEYLNMETSPPTSTNPQKMPKSGPLEPLTPSLVKAFKQEHPRGFVPYRWNRFALRLMSRNAWHAQSILIQFASRSHLRFLPFPYPSVGSVEQWLLQAQSMVNMNTLNRRRHHLALEAGSYTAENLMELGRLRDRCGWKTAFLEDGLLAGFIAARAQKGQRDRLRAAALEETKARVAKESAEMDREIMARQLLGPRGGLPSLRSDLVKLALLLNLDPGPKETVPQLQARIRPLVDLLKNKAPPSKSEQLRVERLDPLASKTPTSSTWSAVSAMSAPKGAMERQEEGCPFSLELHNMELRVQEAMKAQDSRFQAMLGQVLQAVSQGPQLAEDFKLHGKFKKGISQMISQAWHQHRRDQLALSVGSKEIQDVYMATWDAEMREAMNETFAVEFDLTSTFLTEVYTDTEPVAQATRRRGLIAGESLTLGTGWDFHRPEHRHAALKLIRRLKPYVVVLAFPCSAWSQLLALNSSVDLDRLRAEALELVAFAIEVALLQRRGGRHYLMENPKSSLAWKLDIMEEFVVSTGALEVIVDMCRFGLRGPDGDLHKKSTKLLTSMQALVSFFLDKRCLGGHRHTPVIGGKKVTAAAGHYTKAFAEAVVEACLQQFDFERNLFIKDDIYESEVMTIEHDVLATGDEEEVESDASFETSKEDEDKPISAAVKNAVYRLHVNTSHRSNQRLARALLICGAPKEAVLAAKRLKCAVCAERRNPKPRPVAALPPPRDVGQQVHLDLVILEDSLRNPYVVAHATDNVSRYQAAKVLKDKATSSVIHFLTVHWIPLLGRPHTIVADQGREFVSAEFGDWCDANSIYLYHIGVGAPWQNGICERSGATLKALVGAAVQSHAISSFEEMEMTLGEAVAAYNADLNEEGVAPIQLVTGKIPSPGGDVLNNFNARLSEHSLIEAKPTLSKLLAIRETARLSMIRLHYSRGLRQAELARSRSTTAEDAPQPGDLVFFWRAQKYQSRKDIGAGTRRRLMLRRWHGPGLLVATEGRHGTELAANCFISFRGQLTKCPLEHVRKASSLESIAAGSWEAAIDEVINAARQEAQDRPPDELEPDGPTQAEPELYAGQLQPSEIVAALQPPSSAAPSLVGRTAPPSLLETAAGGSEPPGTAAPGTPVPSLILGASQARSSSPLASSTMQRTMERARALDSKAVERGTKRPADGPPPGAEEVFSDVARPSFEALELTHAELERIADNLDLGAQLPSGGAHSHEINALQTARKEYCWSKMSEHQRQLWGDAAFQKQVHKAKAAKPSKSTTACAELPGVRLCGDDPMLPHLLSLGEKRGWHHQSGMGIQVAYNGKSMRTPEPRFSTADFPLRSTFARFSTGDQHFWHRLEAGVEISSLQNQHALIDALSHATPLTENWCRTLRELAANVTTMSDCFAKRRARTRVWYRSTFRNLLEHVPSDVTRFQPFVAKGL